MYSGVGPQVGNTWHTAGVVPARHNAHSKRHCKGMGQGKKVINKGARHGGRAGPAVGQAQGKGTRG